MPNSLPPDQCDNPCESGGDTNTVCIDFKTNDLFGPRYSVSLATLATSLELSIDAASTQKLQLLFSRVKGELTKALYLGLGWVMPNGSWIQNAPAGGQTDYRNNQINTILAQISKHQSLDILIEELFEKGRKYFSNEQYEHIKALCKLYRVLSKNAQFNQAVVDILARMDENKMGVKTNPPLITGNDPEYYGFFKK